jgi:hypothetical protein
MSWLTSYSDTNKVTDEIASRIVKTWQWSGSEWAQYSRTDTESKYRYTSMTKATADTCVTELLAAAPEGTDRTAVARRQNDADAYFVDVNDRVTGAWTAV